MDRDSHSTAGFSDYVILAPYVMMRQRLTIGSPSTRSEQTIALAEIDSLHTPRHMSYGFLLVL